MLGQIARILQDPQLRLPRLRQTAGKRHHLPLGATVGAAEYIGEQEQFLGRFAHGDSVPPGAR